MQMTTNKAQDRYFLLDATTGAVLPIADDGSGRPLVVQWALQMTEAMRRIGLDTVDGFDVSTIFLGLDLRLLPPGDDGPPLVFETSIFGVSGTGPIWQRRCATLEQARQMHAEGLRIAAAGELP